jgi:hypothetical protein
MRVRFKLFQSSIKSWQNLFREAADFATEIGRDKVISISHSADNSQGVVTIWYWGDDRYEAEEE